MNPDFWKWTGKLDEDQLETMSNGMVIQITAQQLREFKAQVQDEVSSIEKVAQEKYRKETAVLDAAAAFVRHEWSSAVDLKGTTSMDYPAEFMVLHDAVCALQGWEPQGKLPTLTYNVNLRERASHLRAKLTEQQRLGGAALVEEVLDLADLLYHVTVVLDTLVAQPGRAPEPEIREVAGSNPVQGATLKPENAIHKARAIVGFVSMMDANGLYFTHVTLKQLDDLCQRMRHEVDHPNQEHVEEPPLALRRLEVEALLSPVMDVRAPYAKILVDRLIALLPMELDSSLIPQLNWLLDSIQQLRPFMNVGHHIPWKNVLFAASTLSQELARLGRRNPGESRPPTTEIEEKL